MDKNKFKNKFSVSSKLIELIMNYINNDIKLKKIFNHHNQKFKNENMLNYIIIIRYVYNQQFIKLFIITLINLKISFQLVQN
jgi:hypothetical protein